ncbi:integrase domain-containing protein [Thalassotalea profundi]|uniref:Integrase n=1 Tax=Thalassotalea profundi TaxID=2036687 RepID=A0ABQ3IJB2_9GAMM|nr:integrase domain-containing protein [Thalassotalea profundi]GHE84487.1 integrase [Thalassotalea profundi]
MARITTPLTNTEVKQAKARDKEYNLSDGEGLQLRIKPNGSKLWLLNYSRPYTKKRVNLGFGKYPDISLADARKLRAEARTLLAKNIDPMEHRDSISNHQKEKIENTLLNVAKKWFQVKKSAVTPNYAEDIWRSLELHVFPYIGKRPISEITAPIAIKTVKPIAEKGSLETVKRINQRLNEIMNYAVNTGLIHSNPLSGVKAAFEKPKKKSMPTIKPDELPQFMQALSIASIKIVTRYIIEWQLHTMIRPGEAVKARWSEIDFEQKLWNIPAETMKRKRPHSVPLTKQALNLLTTIKPISGHREYIFPADRNPRSHANESTANAAIKRMGYHGKLVAHGLRALASTTLNEQGFDPDVIEAALAHVDSNEVRRAYNRADYLKRRAKMMDWWSDHIEKCSTGSFSLSGTKLLKAV